MNCGAKIESKLREKQSEMRHGTEKAQNANLLLFTMNPRPMLLFALILFVFFQQRCSYAFSLPTSMGERPPTPFCSSVQGPRWTISCDLTGIRLRFGCDLNSTQIL